MSCSERSLLALELRELTEAFRWWQLIERLVASEYDFDESNRHLSEIVEVIRKLIAADREWAALLPDEDRQHFHAELKKRSERRLERTVELLEKAGLLDDVIAHMASTAQPSLKAMHDGQ